MNQREPFLKAIKDRVMLFDGAMGTEIQKFNPEPGDFPDNKDGFNDGLVLTRPEWIREIHRNYLKSGADCIETNSFGSNKIKLDEYGFGDRTVEMNKMIARLAVETASEFQDRPRYVIGSMGPTGLLPSSDDPDLGQRPLEEIREAFALQAEGLIQGGVDALLIETSQDILEVKLAIEGSHQVIRESGKSIPLIANATLDQYGKMLLGTDVRAAYTTASGMGIDVFGLNCSTGPSEMTPSIKWLDEYGRHDLLVVPNAGMPENRGGHAVYNMKPDNMADKLGEFLDRYDTVRIIGGCCGTDPGHIAALRKTIDSRTQSGKGTRSQENTT